MEKINNQLVLVKKKKDKILILNIIIIILGTIFISLGAFHTNIWFDESYSVAISNHSFSEIWNIGGNDVHPVFYYMMLKIVSLIFGNNILVFRLFSIVPIVILSILGITHIRKDYGERTGIIFSFLTLFLPIIAAYSSEIRMYTWVMLFVTITAIYANRIYKNELSIKNWVIFALFSLLSAYTHYYGLMFAGIINVILFIYLLKNRKGKNKDLINLKQIDREECIKTFEQYKNQNGSSKKFIRRLPQPLGWRSGTLRADSVADHSVRNHPGKN